ncbi:UDP-arabinose 4-epimerase [Ranunculus cassubicifolius]
MGNPLHWDALGRALRLPDSDRVLAGRVWVRNSGRDKFSLAFLTFLVGKLLATAKDDVHTHFLVILSDLGEMARYDWAEVIYSTLLVRLDTFSTSSLHSGSMGGFYLVVEVWFWEYCRALYHVVPSEDRYPRLSAYFGYDVQRVHRSLITLRDARYQIEAATDSQIVWRPWIDSPHEDATITALGYSHSRCVFDYWGEGSVVVYLGDRLWRQLTGRTAIPISISLPLTLMISEIRAAYQDGRWQDAEVHCLYVRDGCYAAWWRRVSVGHLVAPRYRDGNADYITDDVVRVDLETPGPSQHTGRGVRPRARAVVEPGPEPTLLSQYFTTVTLDGEEDIAAIPDDAFMLSDMELGEDFSRLSTDEMTRRYRRSLQKIAGLQIELAQRTRAMSQEYASRHGSSRETRDYMR